MYSNIKFIVTALTVTGFGTSSLAQDCPSGYVFNNQPPTELNCNPVGQTIRLTCSTGSSSQAVAWYWTTNVCEAGVSGTAILPENTTDNYQFNTIFSPGLRTLIFTVTSLTFGYYWCEIINAVNVSLRSSTITPVLQPTNLSLIPCINSAVSSLHHSTPECAEVNSPMMISHPPLPFISSCSSSSMATYSITLPLIHSSHSLMSVSLTLNPFSAYPTHTLSTINTWTQYTSTQASYSLNQQLSTSKSTPTLATDSCSSVALSASVVSSTLPTTDKLFILLLVLSISALLMVTMCVVINVLVCALIILKRRSKNQGQTNTVDHHFDLSSQFSTLQTVVYGSDCDLNEDQPYYEIVESPNNEENPVVVNVIDSLYSESGDYVEMSSPYDTSNCHTSQANITLNRKPFPYSQPVCSDRTI